MIKMINIMSKVTFKSDMERLIEEKFNFSYLGFEEDFFDNLLKEVKLHEHKQVLTFGKKKIWIQKESNF